MNGAVIQAVSYIGFTQRLVWTLIHSVWQFAIIVLIVGVTLRCMRNQSSRVRYNVMLVAMSLMLLVVVGTLNLVKPEIVVYDTGAGAIVDSEWDTNARQTNLVAVQVSDLPIPSGSLSNDPQVFDTPPKASSVEATPKETESRLYQYIAIANGLVERWMNLILAVWVSGIVLLSVRPIIGCWCVYRLRRVGIAEVPDEIEQIVQRLTQIFGIRRIVQVVESTLVQVPTVIGWLKPLILLPASSLTGLSHDQLEAVIAHELAHIRRYDYLVNAFQILMETVFFYHPAVSWISRRMRIEREECCDDAAISLTGNSIGYARLLVWLEEQRRQPSIVALSSGGGTLTERIRRIVRPQAEAGSPAGMLVASLLVGFVLASGIWISAFADEETPAASTADESVPGFVANISDDLKIELIALLPHEASSYQAWKPNGTAFESPPELPAMSGHSTLRLEGGIDLVFRFTGLTEGQNPTYAMDGLKFWKNPDLVVLARIWAVPAVETTTTPVTVGIPDREWGPWQEVNPNGHLLKPTVVPPPFIQSYDSIKVHDILERDRDRGFILRWACDLKQARLAQIDVIAVDRNDKRHEIYGSTLWDDENDITRTAEVSDLPLSELDHIEYRLRPYRHWVKFDNVAVRPEQESKVGISVWTVAVVNKEIEEPDVVQPTYMLEESRNVYSVGIAKDGLSLYSVSYGTGAAKADHYPRVRTWDLDSKTMVREVPLEWNEEWTRYTNSLTLSHDSRQVFGSLGDEIGIWDSATGKLLRRLDSQWEGFGELTLHSISAATSGNRVACSGMTNRLGLMHDGLLYVWDVETGKMIRAVVSKATGDIRSMALSEDGQRLAAWPARGGVGIWDLESGKQIFEFKNDNLLPADSAPLPEKIPGSFNQVLGMQFSHDGRSLAIGDLCGVKLIDAETGKVRKIIKAPFRYSSQPFNSPTFVFSPNDNLLLRFGVYLEKERTAMLWDTQTGKELATLPIDGTAASFSPEGNTLAIGRSDPEQAIAVWQSAFESETQESKEDIDGVYWNKTGTEEWTSGMKVVKRPTPDDPNVILEYLLRNDADVSRTADLSIISGPSRYLLNANHRIEPWAGAEGSQSYIEKFDVDAGNVLTDPRFRQKFDLTGLEMASYQLKLQSFFSLATDQPGTRLGIPFNHEVSVRPGIAPPPSTASGDIKQKPITQNTELTRHDSNEEDYRSDAAMIHWGEPVGGLRAGIAWSDKRGNSPSVFRHGNLVEADLFVQNFSGNVMQCELTLPHSRDGWGFTIRDPDDMHICRNQTFTTGYGLRRDFSAELKSGEIKRVTGESSEFLEQTAEGLRNSNVAKLQFKVAADQPIAERVPPYSYEQPPDDYTIKAFINVRRASNANVTLSLETSVLKFRVASAGANPDESQSIQNRD